VSRKGHNVLNVNLSSYNFVDVKHSHRVQERYLDLLHKLCACPRLVVWSKQKFISLVNKSNNKSSHSAQQLLSHYLDREVVGHWQVVVMLPQVDEKPAHFYGPTQCAQIPEGHRI